MAGNDFRDFIQKNRILTFFFDLYNTDKKQLTVIWSIREQISQAGHNNCRLDDVPALGVQVYLLIGP